MDLNFLKNQVLDILTEVTKDTTNTTNTNVDNTVILNQQENLTWENISPKRGDHIRVNRGFYYHHGVYFSYNEVIHFTGAGNDNILNWEENQVITSNLTEFLRGGTTEVRIYSAEEEKDLLPPDEIHSYARSCLGTKGYNLFLNNCEHFAYACTLGKHRSEQIEEIINIFDNNAINPQSNQSLSSVISQQLKSNLNSTSITKLIDDNNISEITNLLYKYGSDYFKDNK